MNYGRILKNDIANGPGVRTSLFVSGCTHHCRECFNPETWDFSYGKEYTTKEEGEIIASLLPRYIRGLTILGGEPFEPPNQEAVFGLIQRVRKDIPGKDIWIFSGYDWEELTDEDHPVRTAYTDRILGMIDIIVDGEFHIEEKDISLRFRGSANQRIIDVKKTLATGGVVLSKYIEKVRNS